MLTQSAEASNYIGRKPNSEYYEPLDTRMSPQINNTTSADPSKGYQAIRNTDLNKFWVRGRVFAVLWTEPARDSTPRRPGTSVNGLSQIIPTKYNSKAYTEIRRFVALSINNGNAICS